MRANPKSRPQLTLHSNPHISAEAAPDDVERYEPGLAPAALVTAQEVAGVGYIALVARDLTDRIRFRLEIECTDPDYARWWLRTARRALAELHGIVEPPPRTLQLVRDTEG